MIPVVPQSTVEKPLTPVDYLSLLSQCATVAEVGQYAQSCPEAVRADERFAKAVAGRLGEIKAKR